MPRRQVIFLVHMAHRLAVGVLLLSPATVWAQHDLHRNAVQGIAANDLKWAKHLLKKADPDDPETRFVQALIARRENDLTAAEQAARRALDGGLPFARLLAGPRSLLAPLHTSTAFKNWHTQHANLALLHGPMVGCITDSTASFWVRTASGSVVQVVVGDRKSEPVETNADSDYTAVAVVHGLSPATQYGYKVLIDGKTVKAENTTFTTFPVTGRPAKFAVVFGGGAGYRPAGERVWDTIGAEHPLALLMLGDNVYIDQPEHKLCQYYCYYRRQSRHEWRNLVASTATYAIYDDHDFGTNDCIPGPDIESPPWKRVAWKIFRQNWVNPSYGGGTNQPGCWFDFHIGDVHFIMLDGRYYRDLKGGSMLGPVQKHWLLDTLKNSKATFKVLASPVPWSAGVKPGSRDTWDGFPKEREEVFSFIETNQIDGVFLISADRHRTDLRKTSRPDSYDLYEFESSRLTNRHVHKVVKTPGLIWGYNKTCSFGLLRFDTTRQDPEVTFECVTAEGKVVHRYTLRARELGQN